MSIVEKRHELDYPITPEGRRVSYLLLHLGVPSNYPPTTKHFRVAKKAASSIGILLSTIDIVSEKNNRSGISRYLFRFPYYRRDDKLASLFADTILIAASVAFGPFLDEHNDLSCFRIPMNLIRGRKKVYLGELAQLEEKRPWNERITEFPINIIGSSTGFIDDDVEMTWKLTTIAYNDEKYLHAFRFLKTSQENFYVWPGQIDEVAEDKKATAENIFQQSHLENALQDCFKAIEAILGDPPNNDEKFFRKIRSIGVDPNKVFGFEDKPIFQVIRDINNARDRKAAHGSTKNRIISVRDLFVYQNCARYIVLQACEFAIGKRL